MEDKTLSLTDQIYQELVDGLKTGLDWTQFLAKHGTSKGPLYNAIGRFFNDMEAKVRALNKVQAKLDESGLRLDSLDRQVKEAESSLTPLENKRNVLSEQIETLETKLAEKSELLEHAGELGKLGFDTERLKQLQDALREIGAKHGRKGKEAVSKFFDDLKDYDAVLGAEALLEGLQTKIETKKLEAERWQAEADNLARHHKDLSEAITAVQSLIKRGVKVEQIVSWNGIVSKLGGPEELQGKLGQYGSMSELLNTMKEEVQSYESRLTKVKSQVETLEKERGKIEGAIESLRVVGIKEIKAITEAVEKQVKTVAASEIREAQAVGHEVRTELDKLLEKAVRLGQELERSKQELQKYERVKDTLDSHAVASAEAK